MEPQVSDESSGPSPLTKQELKLNLNLDLLREGPDALQVYPGTPIKKVTLCRFQYVQQDIFQELTTLQSPDLHARAASDPTRASLSPEDTSATSATLAFEISDIPEPEEVELRPPHTVTPSSGPMSWSRTALPPPRTNPSLSSARCRSGGWVSTVIPAWTPATRSGSPTIN